MGLTKDRPIDGEETLVDKGKVITKLLRPTISVR